MQVINLLNMSETTSSSEFQLRALFPRLVSGTYLALGRGKNKTEKEVLAHCAEWYSGKSEKGRRGEA
jgi:hypothetical protein